MDILGPYGWLFAVLGGAILLGLAIAYGMRQSSSKSRRSAAITEAATRAKYDAEEVERQRKEN